MEKSKLLRASVYVGTYKKYNEGSLAGAWMELADYESKDKFVEACKELHSDEEEPEFMYQDYNNIPDGMINENYIDPRIFGIIQCAKDMDDTEIEAFFTFLDMYFVDYSYIKDGEELVEKFRDKYAGKFDSEEAFATYMAEMKWPEELQTEFGQYFDYEAYSRTLLTSGYRHQGDFYFCVA
jgi:antirestriction protein